jgi:apolipoprotein N-acyltransferase
MYPESHIWLAISSTLFTIAAYVGLVINKTIRRQDYVLLIPINIAVTVFGSIFFWSDETHRGTPLDAYPTAAVVSGIFCMAIFIFVCANHLRERRRRRKLGNKGS